MVGIDRRGDPRGGLTVSITIYCSYNIQGVAPVCPAVKPYLPSCEVIHYSPHFSRHSWDRR